MDHFDHVLEPRMTPEGDARGAKGLRIIIVFTSMAIVFVTCRFYERVFVVKRTGPDDWMSLTALVFSISYMGFLVGEKKYGLGNHMNDIPPDILKKQMICFWLSVPQYNSSLFCTKASIVLQYYRVFPTKSMRITCYSALGFLLVYGLWAILSGYLNCLPVTKFWDDSVDGYCINMERLWFSNAIVHIITDIILLSMPMPTLKSLQLPRRQKIALMAVFALGGFVCITSGIRLESLLIIARSKDKSWDNVGAAYWSAIECNTGIVCSCLPSLRPLITRIFPHFTSSDHSEQTKFSAKYRSQSFRRSTNEEIYKMNGIKVTQEVAQESVAIEDCSSERNLVSANLG